ncbi:MAG: hypothetical protein MI924_26280 [Chloroflexales bacterium]|nr:hypothetical protein [Chloroflexales bacterium]
MQCQKVQELLRSSSPADLSSTDHVAVSDHLATCPICRRERDAVQRMDQLVYNWVADAPVRKLEHTKAQIRARHVRRNGQRTRIALAVWSALRPYMLGIAGSLVTLALLLGVSGLFGVPQSRALFNWLLGIEGDNRPTVPVSLEDQDRIWVESLAPPPGTTIQGQMDFTVVLGYTLASAPDAVISVRLVNQPVEQARYFVEPVRVERGAGSIVMSFTVEDYRVWQMLGAGPVQLEAVMRSWDDPPGSEAKLLVKEVFAEAHYTW